MLSVYVTCPSKREAEKISTALVREKLAACANFFPCKSIYEWQGRLVKEKGFALILKTTEKKYPVLVARIRQLHSDGVPCIVATKIARAYQPYVNWVLKQTA